MDTMIYAPRVVGNDQWLPVTKNGRVRFECRENNVIGRTSYFGGSIFAGRTSVIRMLRLCPRTNLHSFSTVRRDRTVKEGSIVRLYSTGIDYLFDYMYKWVVSQTIISRIVSFREVIRIKMYRDFDGTCFRKEKPSLRFNDRSSRCSVEEISRQVTSRRHLLL